MGAPTNSVHNVIAQVGVSSLKLELLYSKRGDEDSEHSKTQLFHISLA